MKIFAMAKMGVRADKTVCEDSILFKADTCYGGVRSIIWGSVFQFEIPGSDGFIAAISDGIGGLAAGETASRFILNSLAETDFPANPAGNQITAEIKSINERLIKLSQTDESLHRMGATLAGILTGADSAWLFHTGNSRIYVTNGSFLRQLTKDHTNSQGKPWKMRDNEILSCMGGGKPEYLDMLQVMDVKQFLPKEGGDGKIIFTTDGIHDHMDNGDLEDILSQTRDNMSFCNAAIKLALKNGSDDDISIMIITI